MFNTDARQFCRALFVFERDAVVGYTNDTIDQFGGSSTIITPQFLGMAEGGVIDLQSIKCPTTAYDKIALSTLNGDGSTKKMYTWKRKRVSGVWQYGWMDMEDLSGFMIGLHFLLEV